jgi:hypothetical protein
MEYEWINVNLEEMGAHFHLELANERLIEEYNNNPERFTSYIKGYLANAFGDIMTPKSLDSFISKINDECTNKKLGLLKNVKNSALN